MFSWLRCRRRARLLAEPFPPAWLDVLTHNVVHYSYLNDAECARLHDDVRIFVAERHWEGCAGLVVTDEMRVTIAALACMLLLGLEHDYFANVESILVYPSDFQLPHRRAAGPLELSQKIDLLGQAVYRGPVILSWRNVRTMRGIPTPGITWCGTSLRINSTCRTGLPMARPLWPAASRPTAGAT